MKKVIFFAFVGLLMVTGCKKDPEISNKITDPVVPINTVENENYGQVKITFNQMVDSSILQLGATTYLNSLGQDYKITKFKYYVSNISLTRIDGYVYKQRESYHLIDVAKGTNYNLILDSVPLGDYKSINFVLGVDSARNTSGAQDGALDPMNGMFWSWNQGYIFLMMEGLSTQSSASNQAIFYHLGGFVKPYSCIRYINPSLGNNLISVKNDNFCQVNIKADEAKLFADRPTINFTHTPNAMGGSIAVGIADNCIKMFSITSVEN